MIHQSVHDPTSPCMIPPFMAQSTVHGSIRPSMQSVSVHAVSVSMSEWCMEPRISHSRNNVLLKFLGNALEWSSLNRAVLALKRCISDESTINDGHDE